MSEKTLRICHLYPDVLNLYGDRGNILCLRRRLEWRGIGCEVTELPIGHNAKLTDFDMFFIGGGQDFEQEVLLDDLWRYKAADLKSAISDGKTFLCICGGYQMMGNYYETADGAKCDYLGAVDFFTVGSRDRMIGNYAFRVGDSVVVGFENHGGRTRLGNGVQPLGTVISGYGNNGEDGTEGVRHLNLFGTYSHGPVLPKNPEFADLLLRTALERKYGSSDMLVPLADKAEKAAHDAVLHKVLHIS